MTRILIGFLPLVLHAAALALAVGVARWLGGVTAWWVVVPLYAVALPTFAGLSTWPVQRHVVAGKFDRDPRTPLYRGRLIYGAAWTAVFYCKPLYHAILILPPLKAWTLRLFGYRGSLAATLYPDTWIRDLPLLHLGDGAYVANRATLGTNIVLANGRILVGPIRLGPGALIGHLTMIAPGCEIGSKADVGVGCAIGMSVRLEDGVRVGPTCTIDHGAVVGARTVVGPMTYLGKRVRLGPDLRIPAGTVIPDRTRIETPSQLLSFLALATTQPKREDTSSTEETS